MNDAHDQAMYVISVAAELAGMHPQTLRVYERKGLVHPHRTEGNTRRYSDRDIEMLRKIQQLTAEGINLAGVTRILDLEARLQQMEEANQRIVAEMERVHEELSSLIHGSNEFPLVPFRDIRRIRRALKSDLIDAASKRRVFFVPPPATEDEAGR